MAGQVYVKVGGVWKEADNYYVKVGGVWKTGTEIHAKVSSTWEGGASTTSGGLPTSAEILGFDVMGFAVPITDGVVDTKYSVNSMGFDVIGFSVPVSGGLQPPNVGQQTYTTPGTHSWTCPVGVTSVCVVVVLSLIHI